MGNRGEVQEKYNKNLTFIFQAAILLPSPIVLMPYSVQHPSGRPIQLEFFLENHLTGAFTNFLKLEDARYLIYLIFE